MDFILYCRLHHFRLYIIGVKNLNVEVDAKYIKEMLNHPDLQPNAIITNGLSQRRRADDDTDPEESNKDTDEGDETNQESNIDKNT